MFCIGKLVEFDRVTKEGRIEQISPERTESFRFYRSELYVDGTMKRKPPRVKVPSYVTYERDDDTGRPGEIMLIQDVRNRGKFVRKIRDNNLEGDEIDLIVRICTTEKEREPVTVKTSLAEDKKPLLSEQTTDKQDNAGNAKENVLKTPEDINNVAAVYAWLDKLNELNLVFDFDYWKSIPDEFKAVMIFHYSNNRKIFRNMRDIIWKVIIPYEKDNNEIIMSMLYFLCSGYIVEEQKKSFLRLANQCLLSAIGEAYIENADINRLLHVILPCCVRESSDYCDAYKIEKTKSMQNNEFQTETYLSCQNNNNEYFGMGNYRCSCLNDKDKQIIGESITNNHFESVGKREYLPDIRDLLKNTKFDIKYILGSLDEEQREADTESYPYQLAAYMVRLEQAFPYLRCGHCHQVLFPDFSIRSNSLRYSLTHFNCPDAKEGSDNLHDSLVYINHCFPCRRRKHVKMILDSRECRYTGKEAEADERDLMLLCMRCGGTEKTDPGRICPNCARELSDEDKRFYQINGFVVCHRCNHNGQLYGMVPQPDLRDPQHNQKQRIREQLRRERRAYAKMKAAERASQNSNDQ